MSSDQGKPLAASAISHGWIRPLDHPELGTRTNGQSVVRYLRFGRAVQVDALLLKPGAAGRWVPYVPSHPAHVTVSVPDKDGRWELVKDVELPPIPPFAGEGLNQEMSIDEMQRLIDRGAAVTHRIELGGLSTSILRVECDREHPVWPSHGECNGGPFMVPFATLDPLVALGTAPTEEMPLPEYLPPLSKGRIAPQAPEGMTVECLPHEVVFRGERLTIGFSLIRPALTQLGWDGVNSGRAQENRLHPRLKSGPLLQSFDADLPASLWTGLVEVLGNRICYRDLTCGFDIRLHASFTVQENGFRLELRQRSGRELPVIEAEGWRLAWNCAAAMTGAAARPTLLPGRNGDVELPVFWAGDGNGCLRCERREGEASLQVESYRVQNAVVGGIVPEPRPSPDRCQLLLPCSRDSAWQWTVDALEPEVQSLSDPGGAVRMHWGSLYSCFRPEYGGFSNNAVSVNCHVNQCCAAELVVFTRKPPRGFDPLELFRFTIERALLGGGGYGYWRGLYLDADPVLVSAAGRIHQARPDTAWLRRISPGLTRAVERMLGTIGDEGLALCRDLSGNSRSWRWSSNAMDVVGFGHMDAYVNAWTYRALRNAAAILRDLGLPALGSRCTGAAERLKDVYARLLLNPETGWVAGWRSRDGQLHDAAYLWLNGYACAFGVLSHEQAAEALRRLERLRRRAGAAHAHFGLPFNLQPIPPEDHMLPQIYGRFTPTFENYTDGAMAPASAVYYLRALQIHGLQEEAEQIAADLEVGFTRGHFNGGVGSGVEFHRWDGSPTGYEGSFVASWAPLYAIAILRGLIKPNEPEWWPS